MKTKLHSLFFVLSLLAGLYEAAAQTSQFFRIVGPTKATITKFRADGSMVWNGATPGATYTVQTVSALPAGTNWVDYVQLLVTNNINTNQIVAFNPPTGMAFIPAGTFTMGDAIDGDLWEDAPLTTVSVSAFYMDQYDVTEGLWAEVYNWALTNRYGFDNTGAEYPKGAGYPVQTVDWYDCVKWCNARSQQADLTPVYYTDAGLTQIYTNGDTDAVYANWSANGYRLPTEAEWEKAARGGLGGLRFPWGNTISWSQANYYGFPASLTSDGYSYDLATAIGYDPAFSDGNNSQFLYTSPVVSFSPNGYGLHDMSGNVWQWCWDWYGAYAGGADPRGQASGSYRVTRGGDWVDYAGGCTTAYRNTYAPDVTGGNIGFRCVRGH